MADVQQPTEIVSLFGGGDMRAETLTQAVLALVRERGDGMPFPTVLGVLRIVERKLMQQQDGE